MPPTPPIHHVYTEQLLPLGHGYPLWDAEPEDQQFEIEIGTVGRVDSGKFWLLFNTMKPADDPYQKHGVPANYEPFRPPTHAPQGPWEKIKFPLVVSQTVCNRDVAAALQAGSADGSISLGGSLKFDCRENTGAFLLLERPAVALVLPAKERIVRYMRDNFEHWLEFANTENGLMLRPEEIYFVHDTVKTSKWAAGAFHGNCRNREGSLQAQLLEVGNFDLSISVSTEEYTRMEYNYGPTGRRLSGSSSTIFAPPGIGVDVADARKCNQCIFFNYFKAKKRFLIGPKYMAAAAGPDELPPPDREDPTDTALADETQWSEEDFEEMPGAGAQPPCDPVDFLLDYILEFSEAIIAVACDTDLYDLFRESGYPEDVPEALKQLKPIIHVDECGAGTVVVDFSNPLLEASGGKQEVSVHPHTEMQSTTARRLPDSSPVERRPREIPPWWEAFRPQSSHDPRRWSDHKTQPLAVRLEKPRRTQNRWDAPQLRWDQRDARVITVTAVSPNYRWVARGDDEGTVILQQVAQRAALYAWNGHDDSEGVSALAFSPNSARLASAHDDGTIIVGEVEQDKPLATLLGHTEAVTILAWSPDGARLASASEDFTIRLWDAETYQRLSLLVGHDEPLLFLKFSPNGRWLVSGGEDCFCLVWDVAAGTLHQELDGHNDPVRAAEFDARSTRVVTCSDDTTARIWSVETGEELLRLEAHRSSVWKAAFSKDGRRVLTVSGTTAKIHDSFTGERNFTFKGKDAAPRATQMLEKRLE